MTTINRNGYNLPVDEVRAVWGYITYHPTASYREIAAGVGLPFTGKISIIISLLAERGFIAREPRKGRAIRVIIPLITRCGA